MLNEERKRKIVEITNERQSVTIAELMEMLGASQSTIRRDLYELNNSRMLKKVQSRKALFRLKSPKNPWRNCLKS